MLNPHRNAKPPLRRDKTFCPPCPPHPTVIDFRLWLALECEPMSKDWIGRMFGERETEKSLAAQRVEEETLIQKRIAELAPTIWRQIETVLKESIAAFNERSSIPINIDPYSKEYTIEVNAQNYQYGWIVKLNVSTGNLSFGNPLTEFIHGNLQIRLDEGSHYSFYDRRNAKENISVDTIDEVLLKGFVKLILKDPSYSVKSEP